MKVENDILVKFTIYNDKVKYNTDDFVMTLFDNSDLIALPLTSLIFTGVKLEFSNLVSLICKDKNLNIVDYSIWDGYLYIDDKKEDGMFYVTEFIPIDSEAEIKDLRSNFLEIKES